MADKSADAAQVSPAPSVIWVLAATLVSGISGYVVMLVVARALGPADYSVFGVFWSALFLIVGVLFGLQQEATRATSEALTAKRDPLVRSSMWVLAGSAAIAVVVIVLGSSAWWAPQTLGPENAGLAIQIAFGSGANAVVATLTGVLAGARLWRHVGSIIATDGVIRLTAVLSTLTLTTSPVALAWAVVAPFPLALGIVFLSSPRVLLRLSASALTYRQLLVNSGHTIVAASATALIINGFPLVLSFFATPKEAAELGSLILAITITRAPVLVPLMALQSYLVTRFTRTVSSPWALINRAFGIIAIVMLVLAVATALWGTALFASIFSTQFALSASALVPLVVSSGFIGALCVTGPALLARGSHRSYSLGWVVASIVACGMLFLPVGLEARAALALSVGPVCGLVFHLAALAQRTHELPRR